MNTYNTKEIDINGKIVNASYQAENKDIVSKLIRDKGHKPVRIDISDFESEKPKLDLFPKKASPKLLTIFCKQMHTMLHAGMPLLSSLDVLENQTDNKYFAKIIKDLSIRVQKGEVLSTAMRAHGDYFPPILISMVASGELTGNLDGVMERMSTHFAKENKINSKIKGAMMYPIVLGSVAVIALVFLLVFVMPTFAGMFSTAERELPGITKFVLSVSNSLVNYWYIYLLIVGGIVIGSNLILKTAKGRLKYDTMLLKLPLIKKPIARIATSRFTRTMSTLLSSGIPLLTSIDSAAEVTNNKYIIKRLEEVSEDIRKGIQLAPLLERVGVFPKMMVSMVGIGEESGALEDMLEKTSDYYDEELDAAISQLVGMMEPLLILIVGVLVGIIIISMLLPMFSLFSVVG